VRQGYKGVKGLWEYHYLITLYPPFNLAACDSRKRFTEEISRTITFTIMFHVKHDDWNQEIGHFS